MHVIVTTLVVFYTSHEGAVLLISFVMVVEGNFISVHVKDSINHQYYRYLSHLVIAYEFKLIKY